MVMLVNAPTSEERRHATVYQQTPTGHHRKSQWLRADSFSRHDSHAGVYRASYGLARQPARALETLQHFFPATHRRSEAIRGGGRSRGSPDDQISGQFLSLEGRPREATAPARRVDRGAGLRAQLRRALSVLPDVP